MTIDAPAAKAFKVVIHVAAALAWITSTTIPAYSIGDRISQINGVLTTLSMVFNRVFFTMHSGYPLDAPSYGHLKRPVGKSLNIACTEEPDFLEKLERSDERYRVPKSSYVALGLGDAVTEKGPTSVWPIKCTPVTYVSIEDKLRNGRLRIAFPNTIDPAKFVAAVAELANDISQIEKYRLTPDRIRFLAYAYTPDNERSAGPSRDLLRGFGNYIDVPRLDNVFTKTDLGEINFAELATIENFDKYVEIEFDFRIRL
jgi:hypothetical protein